MTDETWIDRGEYPFAAHHFKTPAGLMHHVDTGDGPPVVMLHGNPVWSFLYRKLIKRLSPGYRCIAPDLLGFGLSDKPADWSYLPRDHASTLTALLDSLQLQEVTLVFQDWGGPIGLAYALARPERVARIVIMNSWAWPVNRDPYYLAFSGFMGGPVGRVLIRRWNFFVNSVMPRAFGNAEKLTPSAHQHYRKALGSPEKRTGCLVFPRQIVASTPWLAEIWQGLPCLREKPALIVWGMKDIAFRKKELQRWQQAFPEAQSVLLEDVGHFIPEEAPAALGDAVETFLPKGAVS